MSNEDLEGIHDLNHGYALICLPVCYGFGTLNVDDKVILLALEVDLGSLTFSLDHFD